MKPDLGLCLSVSFAGSSVDGVPNLKQTSQVKGVAWEGEQRQGYSAFLTAV